MTTRAGETRQGLLWKQEHLAPLPIPTGQPAKDLLNLIWRKNDVYLDIGSFAMGAGWLVLHFGTVVAAMPGVLAGFYLGMPMGLIAVIPITAFMAFMWWLYSRSWRQPLRPPLRFNRQRREVCITRPDGSFWFVPWERVHALTPSATQLGPYGAGTSGALILWLPLEGQEHEPYHPNKEGWVMMTSPGGGASAMAQWECIRSFMEVGPQAVPEPTVVPDAHLTPWQSYLQGCRNAAKDHGWFRALAWEGFAGLFVGNVVLLDYLLRKKLANVPDLTAPEALEWSKPLPPEKWAKRSPELERAIAEREAELVGTAKDPQPTVQA
jgi:hypothetical protein